MSKQVKIRRGTAAEHATFTGVVGEVTVDTTNKTVRVHDGSTAGGNPVALASGANASGTWGINVTGNAATATSLSGTLAVASGGTGSATASGARSNLSAAASGANTDITTVRADLKLNATGTPQDDTLGFRGIPQSTDTTPDSSEIGQHVYTSSNVTVTGSSFNVGDAFLIANSGGSDLTIIEGASTTLRIAGSPDTGNITLAQYGVASVICVASGVFYVSGAGVS
jgi:hypothetical protein